MNEEQGIKVVYCGSPMYCEFEDRISIEFSPSELTMLTIHFTKAAMIAEMYSGQTEMREQRETFNRA
jgi:hypothetical protein